MNIDKKLDTIANNIIDDLLKENWSLITAMVDFSKISDKYWEHDFLYNSEFVKISKLVGESTADYKPYLGKVDSDNFNRIINKYDNGFTGATWVYLMALIVGTLKNRYPTLFE